MNLIDTPNLNQPATSGEDQHHYRQNSSGRRTGQGPSVPSLWHGSNRAWPASALLKSRWQATPVFDPASILLLRQRLTGGLELPAFRGVHLRVGRTELFQCFHDGR